MPDVFDIMLDGLFASVNSAAATYNGTACRVAWRQPEQPVSGLGVQVDTALREIEVRVSEIATVAEDAVFVIAGDSYTVTRSRLDRDGRLWIVEVK